MFAHEIILAKEGPLARIWLAAHWDKKLKKKDIFETKLVESVENIINPRMKLALRTSGHLLLGVVKIYSRKTGFLYTDCNEAITKLQSAFRRGVDAQLTQKETKSRAKAAPILLTADLDLPDIDTPIPDLNDLDLDKNRARLEEITLREENDFLNVDDLEITGDQAYNSELAIDLDNEEMMRNLNEVFGDNQMDTFSSALIDDDCLKTETQYDDDQDMSHKVNNETAENPDKMIDDLQNPMSQAPPSVRSDYDQPESPAHYSPAPSPLGGGGMDSPPMSPMMPPSRPPRPDTASSMMSEGGTPTPIAFGAIQRSETPMSQRAQTPQPMPDAPPTPISHYQEAPPSPQVIHHTPIQQPMSTNQMMNSMHQQKTTSPSGGTAASSATPPQRMNLRERKEPAHNQYMDQSEQQNQSRSGRQRRVRRQLIIDQQIGIDAETMKAQLRDASDIVGTLVMAPPVEKLLRSKEESNPEKLFNTPIGRIHVGLHATCFTANCRTDLPASALLRQEQASVKMFAAEGERRHEQPHYSMSTMNQHNDSDDEDVYSNYGPQSVASSYVPDNDQQMSKNVDNQEQDTAWARATGQDISNVNSFEQNIPVEQSPARPESSFSSTSKVSEQPMTPAPPTPLPDYEAPDSPGAAPLSPPEPDSPLPPPTPQTPQHQQQQHREEPISSSSLNSSYEPEPKRLRTASAEAELKEVEAGKGTGACIKYTQRLLSENVDVSFNQMAHNDTRKLAAQKFYSLLVMLKHEQITAVQPRPYDDITINKGINFGGVISDHC